MLEITDGHITGNESSHRIDTDPPKVKITNGTEDGNTVTLVPGGNFDIDEPIVLKPGETVIVPMKDEWLTSKD